MVEKKRKEKISKNILHIQTLLPVEYRNQKHKDVSAIFPWMSMKSFLSVMFSLMIFGEMLSLLMSENLCFKTAAHVRSV